MTDYYRIPCETIGRSDWWTHIAEPPRWTPGPFWGFFPEIGNDEEGWGHVQIVYYDHHIWNLRDIWYWCGWRGERLEPQPLMWADINSPLVPFTATNEATARAEALAAIQQAVKPTY
jgi:hypothetical protein